jgi:Icc-related predicted phosphoesterase
MKVVALVDIHGSVDKVKALKKKFEGQDIDLVLCMGDLTNEGSLKVVKEIVEDLSFGKKLLIVPGNMDNQAVLDYLEQEKVLLHKNSVKLEGLSFVGLGGALPKNTWYKLNIGELEVKKVLTALLEGQTNVVLLTHSPPYGVGIDECDAGYGLGSRKLFELIEKYQPLIHLCGHAHDSKGEARIKETVSINIGPLGDGNALLLDLEKGKKPNFKRIKV